MTSTYFQDPQDVLDYETDWTTWLDGDTITAATVVATTGLTVANVANTTAAVTYRVSGGTANTDYTVTMHIETAAGLEKDRSYRFLIRQQ